MANFGATATSVPILLTMYYVALALFLFWCALLISSVRGKPTWWRFAWDAITGLSIIIICTTFSHFILWENPNPPDGTLAIGDGIWVTENGQREWIKLPFMQIEPEIAGDRTLYYSEYRYQRCVWLDENKIIVNKDAPTFDSLEDYLTLHGPGQLKPARSYIRWERHGFFKALRMSLTTGKENAISRARDAQIYRTLTPEEQARFIEKQQCMKRAFETHSESFVLHKNIEETCDTSIYPDEPEDLRWGWF